MGTTTSHHHHLDTPLAMDQPMYTDFNLIFKSIPKMLQVADDMHVLSQAVTDMRNLTYALSLMMLLGMCAFLVLKCLQGRRGKSRRRRRLQNHTDSEQSSLNRPYRQYTQKPLDWNHHHKVDMEKLLEHSSSSHGSQQHTPPAITPKRIPDFHIVERTPPPVMQTTPLPTQTQNGNIKHTHYTKYLFNDDPSHDNSKTEMKRLDPVKLMIDELP